MRPGFWMTAILLCLALAACVPEDDGTEPPVPEPAPVAPPFESSGDAVLHMGAGWNLGNTLDSHSGSLDHMWIEAWSGRTPKDYETAWGQPQVTRALIHMLKSAGFGAVRIPVTWYPHIGRITLHDTEKWNPADWVGYEVDAAWMARVKEVVDFVIDEGMYCILNVHHDTGASDTAWLVAGEDAFESAKARYQSLWEQIALTFRDYGEKLLFESYNEMLDTLDSWCFASFASPARYDAGIAASAYNGINRYARLFVETVRGTGGNNAMRNLIINTYGACSGDGTWNTHLKDPLIQLQIPEAPGHLAVQIHSYWEADKFDAQKTDIDRLFSNINYYLQKRLGVPVIIGEWGGGTSEDSEANVLFSSYFSAKAKANGVAAFYWMGLSDGRDRSVPRWSMPRTKDAILQPYVSD